MDFDGRAYALAGRSVTIVADGQVAMDTSRVAETDVVRRVMRPMRAGLSAWGWHAEPVAGEAEPPAWAVTAKQPVEQLTLTADRWDYCWHATTLTVKPVPKAKRGAGAAEPGTLSLQGVADVAHVFIDGKLAASTPLPLSEDRGAVDASGFTQTFQLSLAAGKHRLAILCCSLGLIKGDWMLGHTNMALERKGLWGRVSWQGKPLAGPWTMQPGLVGERCRVFADAGMLVSWQAAPVKPRPMSWYRASFRRPRGDSPLALDLTGMNKGLAWLNGQCIGRYWLVAAHESPQSWLTGMAENDPVGQPTQRYYHLPTDWLRDDNTLVLLEELGGNPRQIRLCQWESSSK